MAPRRITSGADRFARAEMIVVDASFDEGGVDRFVDAATRMPDAPRRLIIDATRVRWLSPAGLVSLFVVGDWLRRRGFPRPHLLLPINASVRGYWARLGVARYAADHFDVHGDLSPFEDARDRSIIALTEVEPRANGSVEGSRLGDLFHRIADVLRGELGLGTTSAVALTLELSEAAAEMMTESGSAVWFSAQTYSWRARLGRRVVICALGCNGYRPRVALENRHASTYGSRWNDATALEAAFFHGFTRFTAAHAGSRGFVRLRRAASRLDGRVTVRSGTARLSDVPSWDHGDPLATDLPKYPGTLLTLLIPQRRPEVR